MNSSSIFFHLLEPFLEPWSHGASHSAAATQRLYHHSTAPQPALHTDEAAVAATLRGATEQPKRWDGFLLILIFPQQQNLAMGSLAKMSSGAIRWSFNTRFRTRFRRVLVDTSSGSGGFWCRYLARFRRVPVKIPAEAPEGSVRFRRVPVQIPCEVPEVLEGFGAGTWWGSGSFRCSYLMRFRRV